MLCPFLEVVLLLFLDKSRSFNNIQMLVLVKATVKIITSLLILLIIVPVYKFLSSFPDNAVKLEQAVISRRADLIEADNVPETNLIVTCSA